MYHNENCENYMCWLNNTHTFGILGYCYKEDKKYMYYDMIKVQSTVNDLENTE
jgi:hypothetical protein